MTKVIKQHEVWTKLRSLLNNNYAYSDDWKKAIEIFEHRFDSHYFFPLDILVNRRDHEGEGFSIMTVICSFIESLAAFESGKIFNLRYKPAVDPSYHYKSSRELYIDFLHNTEIFENHFWRMNNGAKEPDQPYSAEEFYENVRCGLVHEGRTKNNWTINATKSDNLSSPVFIKTNGTRKSVMRSILHRRMMDHLANYIKSLKANSQQGEALRRLFARKMDHLFEIPADLSYDWWIDP
ncbi:MAG: hypothetical protein JST32_18260 [Bacteroidetes bacterium]|nr:hypothetical protein [Bacteroidota bacterium]